ncbi:MAG: hypothetical protein K2N01_11105 [Lachnospiraceae bacterium]|nr:hypothetical protein [Lachnospiraceae bacterium]
MTYQQFQQEITKRIRRSLTNEATVSLQSISKNNEVRLDGLTITSGDCNISPTIYLNNFYDSYEQGESLEDITTEIIRIYRDNRPLESVNASFYTDLNRVRDKLMFKLIHYQKNRTLLKDIPHMRCMDLAIVFYCLVSVTPSGSATILVRNNHLSLWNISKDTLLSYALQNNQERLPATLAPLSDLISDALPDTDFPEPSHTQPELHILTNRHKLFGAGCMLYPKLLHDISGRFDSDLIILPSSVHEVLLFPDTAHQEHAALNEMVREVNLTQVSPEEVLSDHIYLYSRQDNCIHYNRESYSFS